MSKSKKVLIPLSMFKKVIDNKQSYIFRSKLEANFAFLFDSLPAVLKWNYESISVSYFLSTDKKYHQYILDFTLETIDNKIMLIEIKPNSKLNKNLLISKVGNIHGITAIKINNGGINFMIAALLAVLEFI